MTYWDSSAILKLYVSEPDSEYLVNLADAEEVQIYSSAILTVEALCALSRKEQAGEITHSAAAYRDLEDDIAQGWVVLVPYGAAVVTGAQRVLEMIRKARPPRVLRSLDIIHLASALECKATSLVATDARLRQVAALAGLQVLP